MHLSTVWKNCMASTIIKFWGFLLILCFYYLVICQDNICRSDWSAANKQPGDITVASFICWTSAFFIDSWFICCYISSKSRLDILHFLQQAKEHALNTKNILLLLWRVLLDLCGITTFQHRIRTFQTFLIFESF